MTRRFRNTNPSYRQGFARDPADIADPMARSLREHCKGLWVPSLGRMAGVLKDVMRKSADATVASPTWVASKYGPAVRGVVTTAMPLATLTNFACILGAAFDTFAWDTPLSLIASTGRLYFGDLDGDSKLELYLRTESPYEADTVEAAGTLTNGAWYVLGARLRDTEMSLWINGVKESATGTHTNPVQLDLNPSFGITAGSTALFAWLDGRIEDQQMRLAGRDPFCLVRKTRWLTPVAAPVSAGPLRWPWQQRRHRRMSGVR